MAENYKKKELLITSLKDTCGLQQILDISHKIIGNPLVVFGMVYNLLGNSENIVTDDNLWNELTINGVFSHESFIFFRTEKFLDIYSESEVVCILKSPNLKYDRLNGKLFDKNDEQIGDVILVACYKPIENEDIYLMEIISEAISIELQKVGLVHNNELTQTEIIINDLIDGNNIDKKLAESALNSFYFDIKSNLYVAVVDIIKHESTLTHLIYFKNLFQQMQPEFHYFVYLNSIVIIISTDESTLNITKNMNTLNEFFRKNNIYAGISISFQNLLDLKKYYRQAINALNYGLKNDFENNIFKYDVFRLDSFLNSICDSVDLTEICNPIIFSIIEYDKNNGTEFFNIVRMCLLTGSNFQLTSEKLEMDYSKLCTSLKTIEDLFEINWDNGNMLFSIFISIKALEYLNSDIL